MGSTLVTLTLSCSPVWPVPPLSPALCVVQRCPDSPGPQKPQCASRRWLSLPSPPVTHFLSAPQSAGSWAPASCPQHTLHAPHAVLVQVSTGLAEILSGLPRQAPSVRRLQTFCPRHWHPALTPSSPPASPSGFNPSKAIPRALLSHCCPQLRAVSGALHLSGE